MILVGLEDCHTCKIAHGVLSDIEYVILYKNRSVSQTDPRSLDIKRALGKLNPVGHFPVILSDDMKNIILTDDVLNNLNKQKLEDVLLNK